MSSTRLRDRPRMQQVSYEDIERIRDNEYNRLALPRSPSQDNKTTNPRALIRVDREDDRQFNSHLSPSSSSTPRPYYENDNNNEHDYEIDRITTRRHLSVPDHEYDRREVRISRRGLSSSRQSETPMNPRRELNNDSGTDTDDDAARRRRDRRRRSHSAASPDREFTRRSSTRDRSAHPPSSRETQKCAVNDNGNKGNGNGNNFLWYSHRRRSEANFLEKHFDSSYDGLLAGVAGAAIGSITAARFGGDEHRKFKALGGALLGAVALNSAENHYRVFTEAREEIHEKKEMAKEQLHGAAQLAGRALQ